jgi:hypothetical protein
VKKENNNIIDRKKTEKKRVESFVADNLEQDRKAQGRLEEWKGKRE